MADTLALDYLYTTVTAAYTAASDTTPHYFGWEEPPKQLRQRSRIIWVPGAPSGDVGQIVAPRYPGSFPARPLANLDEIFHVYIHGVATTVDKSLEISHYRTARFMFDTWYGRVYRAVHGTFAITSLQWHPGTEPSEFRRGACILVVGTIQAVIPDIQDSDAAPLNAELDVTELNVTEQLAVDNGAIP